MEYPVLLLTNGVLLPGARLKLPIRSKNNVSTLEQLEKVRDGLRQSVVIAYRINDDKVYEIATMAYIDQISCWSYNSHVQYSVNVVGCLRVKIEKLNLSMATVKVLNDKNENLTENSTEKLLLCAKKLMENRDNFSIKNVLKETTSKGLIVDICAAQCKSATYLEMLDFLGQLDVEERLKTLIGWVENIAAKQRQTELAVNAMSRNIGGRKKPTNPVDVLEEKLKGCQFPEEIQDRVHGELERLRGMNQSQTEFNILQNWLEFVAALPWADSPESEIDIKKAKQMLDQSHDSMADVKQRVLEHLAVCKMNSNNMNGMILCFSGPPGIGKTSIAKAIAEAMGRKFQRISLGGIRDESDIRGHRRTYVAAMPGRVLEAFKSAKSNNPVVLLDEVDKLYSGNQGSPSAALLELLDPEQNSSFSDHYLNMPFDVSKAMFIATANDLSTIEPALRDRLEIIEMSGYSVKEKVRIATNHLLERQLIKHGICPDYMKVHPDALRAIVEEYTREAGVRQLERHIAQLCRHVAFRLADALNGEVNADVMPDFQLPVNISLKDVHEILKNSPRIRGSVVDRMSPLKTGVCFGLSVSGFGGQVMPIEASKNEGTGKVLTTGKLGKVLEESVLVAKSWIAANAKRMSLSPLTSDSDIHVHLPEGAVSKDGPSAGCGLVAALASLSADLPLRSDTAITGEISLTGHVLPVGGIKDKVLAAQREGLRRVVLPSANSTDVDKLDADVKSQLDIVFVDTVDQVVHEMLTCNYVLSKL